MWVDLDGTQQMLYKTPRFLQDKINHCDVEYYMASIGKACVV